MYILLLFNNENIQILVIRLRKIFIITIYTL